MAGSPTHPSPSEASVIPNWVVAGSRPGSLRPPGRASPRTVLFDERLDLGRPDPDVRELRGDEKPFRKTRKNAKEESPEREREIHRYHRFHPGGCERRGGSLSPQVPSAPDFRFDGSEPSIRRDNNHRSAAKTRRQSRRR